jgi:integrase
MPASSPYSESSKRWQRFEARRLDYTPSEFVFTKPSGGSYHPQSVSKTMARLSERARLPRLTAHGLRHTSATLMLDNGVPTKVAAERLGHSDATLFMNLYSHVTPTMQKEAADRIGQALFGDA